MLISVSTMWLRHLSWSLIHVKLNKDMRFKVIKIWIMISFCRLDLKTKTFEFQWNYVYCTIPQVCFDTFSCKTYNTNFGEILIKHLDILRTTCIHRTWMSCPLLQGKHKNVNNYYMYSKSRVFYIRIML
jgi:hypothetical protein